MDIPIKTCYCKHHIEKNINTSKITPAVWRSKLLRGTRAVLTDSFDRDGFGQVPWKVHLKKTPDLNKIKKKNASYNRKSGFHKKVKKKNFNNNV